MTREERREAREKRHQERRRYRQRAKQLRRALRRGRRAQIAQKFLAVPPGLFPELCQEAARALARQSAPFSSMTAP